jgi:acyl-CoA reductase-like NAD-dependent aldehyde dehydrogenase
VIDFDRGYRHTINGRLATSGSTFPAFNPATRSVIADVPDATRQQLDEAVDGATAAFAHWRSSTRDERSAALHGIADCIEKHAGDFMRLLTREQGKPRAAAEWEIGGSAIWCREIAKQSLPDELIEETPDRKVITRFSPLGVVGGIVPWNFPVLLAIWKIAPALATGNTIVVKPSPFTRSARSSSASSAATCCRPACSTC